MTLPQTLFGHTSNWTAILSPFQQVHHPSGISIHAFHPPSWLLSRIKPSSGLWKRLLSPSRTSIVPFPVLVFFLQPNPSNPPTPLRPRAASVFTLLSFSALHTSDHSLHLQTLSFLGFHDTSLSCYSSSLTGLSVLHR